MSASASWMRARRATAPRSSLSAAGRGGRPPCGASPPRSHRRGRVGRIAHSLVARWAAGVVAGQRRGRAAAAGRVEHGRIPPRLIGTSSDRTANGAALHGRRGRRYRWPTKPSVCPSPEPVARDGPVRPLRAPETARPPRSVLPRCDSEDRRAGGGPTPLLLVKAEPGVATGAGDVDGMPSTPRHRRLVFPVVMGGAGRLGSVVHLTREGVVKGRCACSHRRAGRRGHRCRRHTRQRPTDRQGPLPRRLHQRRLRLRRHPGPGQRGRLGQLPLQPARLVTVPVLPGERPRHRRDHQPGDRRHLHQRLHLQQQGPHDRRQRRRHHHHHRLRLRRLPLLRRQRQARAPRPRPGRFAFDIDYNGTPGDPSDDVEVPDSFRIVRPSTGHSDFSGRDFCADLVEFTS